MYLAGIYNGIDYYPAICFCISFPIILKPINIIWIWAH